VALAAARQVAAQTVGIARDEGSAAPIARAPR
jgi:hypothetical protein